MSGDHDVTCSSPIDMARLDDYWLGALDDAEESVVEEHLLGCDGCSGRLREVVVLAEGLRGLARQGDLRMVVSEAYVQRAKQEGKRVREYAPWSGGSVQCTVAADDDLLITRLTADLGGAARVDLVLFDEHGIEQVRLTDIPVDSGAGVVVYQESMSFAKALPDTTLIARLVALDAAGAEHLLGEYTFHHTRTIP